VTAAVMRIDAKLEALLRLYEEDEDEDDEEESDSWEREKIVALRRDIRNLIEHLQARPSK
jgi:hypothetical protein